MLHLFNDASGRSYCGGDGNTTSVQALVTCSMCFAVRKHKIEEDKANPHRQAFVEIARDIMYDDPEWAISIIHIIDLYDVDGPHEDAV